MEFSVSIYVCCVFMVYKEYHVDHIRGTGSSITAHSPHISPLFETVNPHVQKNRNAQTDYFCPVFIS